MKNKIFFTLLFVFSGQAFANGNMLDELNPFDPLIEEKLLEMDAAYEKATGLSAHPIDPGKDLFTSCYQRSCPVFIDVNKSSQMAQLFVEGSFVGEWKVSTGMAGYTTPNFDTHPNGRIYNAYTSSTYPGGDYNGLGNMPYAVFIRGGFAIHGTVAANWPYLGSRASHGCIRLHPDHGYYFNRMVRKYGISGTWITVR